MTLADRINNALHPLLVRHVLRSYNRRIGRAEVRHPELFRPVDASVTQAHLALYGRLGLPCSDKWLRLFCNLSGVVDHRYLPEDLFFARIERILNDCNRAGSEAEDKNQYSLFIDKKYQPRFVLRFIRGSFFDEDYRFVDDNRAEGILQSSQGDLIGKESVSSYGGHGIRLFRFENGCYADDSGVRLCVAWIRQNFISYVLQERIEQCDFSARFNPSSANTCRIVTVRCPWDGRTVVIKAGMRFGVSKEVYDNLSSGGVCVPLGPAGELSAVARNWYKLDTWETHPSSGIRFGGQKHPFYGKMAEVACEMAARMPNFNLLSWDFLADKSGDVKILEVNETSQGCDWLQYDFGPFFGEVTEPVVDWCATHLKYDVYRHFRSWWT